MDSPTMKILRFLGVVCFGSICFGIGLTRSAPLQYAVLGGLSVFVAATVGGMLIVLPWIAVKRMRSARLENG
jgi:hypothetical protein